MLLPLLLLLGILGAPPTPAAAASEVPVSHREDGATEGVWYWALPDTPNGLRPTQSWSGAGSAPNGDIYVAGMDHRTNAALYRLPAGDDPGQGPGRVLAYVGDARAASEAAGNWQADETAEKFHTRPTWHRGRVYVATLDHSRLDAGHEAKRGFHWYAYDPARGRFEDLSAEEPGGVAAAHGGLAGIVADQRRDVIYGAMLPTGELYALDVAAGRTRRLGRPAYGRAYVYAGRALWLDRAGRVYFSAGNSGSGPSLGTPYDPAIFGHVRYYDPGSGRFGEMRDWQLRDQRAVDAAQCFADAGTCYLADNVGHLYRFDDDADDAGAADAGPRWRYLGGIGQETRERYGLTWVMHVRDDRTLAYLVTVRGHLFEFDLAAGQVRRAVNLRDREPAMRGRIFCYGSGAWDRGGRFYFVAFGRPDAGFRARLVAIDPTRFLAAAAGVPAPAVATPP
jgi:outer membrane protein assembly factor BamB